MRRIREHQDDIVRWLRSALSPHHVVHKRERFLRALEELLEAGQMIDGVTKYDIDAIFAQVWEKPVEKDPTVEIGGALFTLLGLANALGVDAESALEAVKARGWQIIPRIREKHLLKYRAEELDQYIGVDNAEG